MEAADCKGPQAMECGWLLEAGKVKAIDCPLRLPQGTSSISTFTFSLIKPFSDS